MYTFLDDISTLPMCHRLSFMRRFTNIPWLYFRLFDIYLLIINEGLSFLFCPYTCHMSNVKFVKATTKNVLYD